MKFLNTKTLSNIQVAPAALKQNFHDVQPIERIKAGTGHLPEAVSPQYRNPANPWTEVASYLIWLGAREIQETVALPGVDSNAVLAEISSFCHLSTVDYQTREAATAQVLANSYISIILRDGTRADRGCN